MTGPNTFDFSSPDMPEEESSGFGSFDFSSPDAPDGDQSQSALSFDTLIGQLKPITQKPSDSFNWFMGQAAKTGERLGWLQQTGTDLVGKAVKNIVPGDAEDEFVDTWEAVQTGMGGSLRSRSKESSEYWLDKVSEEFKSKASAGLDDPEFGVTTLYAAALGSLPEMMLTMGSGALAGKLTQLSASVGVARIAAAAEAGSPIASKMLSYSKYAPMVAGAAAGGATEGALAAGATGIAMEERVNAMTHEELLEGSDRYRDVYDSAIGEDEEARRAYAKRTIAEELGRTTASWVGLTTAALGAPTGAIAGHLGGRAAGAVGLDGAMKKIEGSVVGQAATGFAAEGAQEFLQEGSQQFLTNLGIKGYANSKQDLSEGVLDNAVIGGLVGGIMGGAMTPALGGAARAQAKGEAAVEATDPVAEFKYSRNPQLEAKIEEQLNGLKDAGVPAAEFQKVARWANDRSALEFSKALEQLLETGAAPENVTAFTGEDFDENGMLTEAAYQKDARRFAFDVELRIKPTDENRADVLEALAADGANPYIMGDGTMVVPQSLPGAPGLQAVADSIQRRTGAAVEVITRESDQAAEDAAAASAESAVSAEAAKRAEAEGVLKDEDIVNPIPRDATPEQKLEAIHMLTAENKPLVDQFLSEMDGEIGTVSVSNIKKDETILAKAKRPSVLAEKPWHDIEHVRDTFRFMSVVEHPTQLEQIAQKIKEKGWEVIKVDTEKLTKPKGWGWRFVGFDLRMPNGQLVEFYAPFKEVEDVKNGLGHELFEKWRGKGELTDAEAIEMRKDMERSYAAYEAAYQSALSRAGSDESAALASASNFAATLGSTGPSLSMKSSALKDEPRDQTPSTLDATKSSSITDTSDKSSDAQTRSSISTSEAGASAGNETLPQVDAPRKSVTVKDEAGLEEMGRTSASHPDNDIEPTERQLAAGNYPKGHGTLKGADPREDVKVSIENVPGSIRRGKGWSRKMKHWYGYVRGTPHRGDGQLDVYMGRDAHDNSLPVFVIHQNDVDGKFDEPKVMMGYKKEGEAKAAYLSEYPAHLGPKLFGGITRLSRAQFADYIESGDTDVPPNPMSKAPMLSMRKPPVEEAKPEYTIQPYRYAKGQMVVRPVSDGSGWKTRAARLADAMKGRWSHRAGGYVMSPAKASKFEALYAQGWDGNAFTGELNAPIEAPSEVPVTRKGKAKAGKAEAPARARKPGLLKLNKATDTEGFKKWSKGFPVYEPDQLGNFWDDSYHNGPAVFTLYHGTMRNFDAFSKSMAGIESNMGAGFYFTNTAEDAGRNYATSRGADMQVKIEREIERMQNDEEFEDMGEDALRLLVEERMFEHDGAMLKVFVKTENPVIVGGPNETRLTFEEKYDEETDEYEEPTGTLIDFVEALKEEASNYSDVSDEKIDQFASEVYQAAMDYGDIGIERVREMLSDSEAIIYAVDYDNDGALASSEIFRATLERMGFDAIIDYKVDVKFGTQSRMGKFGKGLPGMNANTVHVIAFKPNQIKSATGNSGAFATDNDSLVASIAPTTQANSTPHDEVVKLAADVVSKIKAAPTVTVHSSESSLPAHLHDQILDHGLQGLVEGMFDPNYGDVHIISKNLQLREGETVADAVERVVAEETLGHYGLQAVFGEREMNKLLDQVWRDAHATPRMKSIIKDYGDVYGDIGDAAAQRNMANEYLSKLSPTTRPTLWQKITAWLREALRNAGFVRTWSDNDLKVLMDRVFYSVRTGHTPASLTKLRKATLSVDGLVPTVTVRDGKGLRDVVYDGGTRRITADGYRATLQDGMESGLPAADVSSFSGNLRQLAEYVAEEGKSLIVAPESVITAAMVEKAGFDSYVDEGARIVRIPDEMIGATRKDTAAMFSLRNRAKGDAEVERILSKTVQEHTHEMGWGQRFNQWFRELTGYFGNADTWLELKTGWIDSATIIEKLERGKFSGKLLDAAESAYKMVSLTKNLPQLMAAVSKVGVPTYKDGSFVRVKGRKGLYDIFGPLFRTDDGKNLLHLWEGYAIARRSSQLIHQTNPDGTSKEKLLSAQEIETLLNLERQYPQFRKVFDEWQEFNRQLLELAVDRGALSREAADLWMQNDYVPFYRVDEEEDVAAGITRKRGLSGQRVTSKRLTGSDKRIQPVLENIMLNTASIIEKVYKNEAMNRIVALTDGVAMTQEPLRAEAVKVSNEDIARAMKKAGLFVGDDSNSTPLQRKAGKLLRDNDIDYAVRAVEQMTPEQREAWTTLFRRVRPDGQDVVSVMVAGKPVYYRVHDPLLLRAIMDMTPVNFGALVDFMGGAKRLLTNMVTLDPGFMAANWMRDTLSSWAVVSEDFRPFRDAPSGAAEIWTESGLATDLALAGGMTGGFYDPTQDFADVMTEVADPGVNVLNSPKKLLDTYRKIGMVSEQVNRLAIAKAVLRRGGSMAEAAYQAQDVLNFSQSGDAVAAQLLIRTVPFLNARIQGLYRLWKGARGLDGRDPLKARMAFLLKGLLLAAISMLHALRNQGDERYEKLPDFQKDTYWHFFVGDQHYAIPKPFEVGVLFSTIPERAMRLISGTDSGRTTGQSIARALGDTFAFNPIPQLFKPIVEQWANRSFFTSRPIVGLELEGLEPQAQYNPWTSETARAVTGMIDSVVPDSLNRFAPETLRSPTRLEHAMRAYLGTVGGYILQLSDASLRGAGFFPAAPAMGSIRDVPVIGGATGRFVRGEPDLQSSSKYADDLYDALGKADDAYRTLNAYIRQGNLEAAEELADRRINELTVRPILHDFREAAAEINTQSRLIMQSDLSPEEKRAQLDELTRTKNEVMREAIPYLALLGYQGE